MVFPKLSKPLEWKGEDWKDKEISNTAFFASSSPDFLRAEIRSGFLQGMQSRISGHDLAILSS